MAYAGVRMDGSMGGPDIPAPAGWAYRGNQMICVYRLMVESGAIIPRERWWRSWLTERLIHGVMTGMNMVNCFSSIPWWGTCGIWFPGRITGSLGVERLKIPWFINGCINMRIIFITIPIWPGINHAMEPPMILEVGMLMWEWGSIRQIIFRSIGGISLWLGTSMEEGSILKNCKGRGAGILRGTNRMCFLIRMNGFVEWKWVWGRMERFMDWIGVIRANVMIIRGFTEPVEEFTSFIINRIQWRIFQLLKTRPKIRKCSCAIRMHGLPVNGWVYFPSEGWLITRKPFRSVKRFWAIKRKWPRSDCGRCGVCTCWDWQSRKTFWMIRMSIFGHGRSVCWPINRRLILSSDRWKSLLLSKIQNF